MNFGRAIEILKHGGKVERAGWNGKGMFVFLVPGSTFTVNRAPLLGIYPAGTEITYRPHIGIKGVDGGISTWAPSIGDVLANDWLPTADSAVVNVIEPTASVLPPHQQRVVDERTELDDKLSKLVGFFPSVLFSMLPGAEQGRMRTQAVAMRTYSEILAERIAAFPA